MAEALCTNPLFNVGIALGVGACIGFAVAFILLGMSCALKRW